METDSLMYEIKTEDVYEDFSSNKEIFGFSDYLTQSKYYDDSNKSVTGKMENETRGATFEEFARLKPKMYSVFVADNSEYKKAKGVNRNVAATKSHNEYQDVLLNNKCLRINVFKRLSTFLILSSIFLPSVLQIYMVSYISVLYGHLCLRRM